MNIADIAAIVNAGGGGGGGAGGGSAYDFIIRIDITTSMPAYSLYSGDFDAVAKKLQAKEPVFGATIQTNDNLDGFVGVAKLAYGGATYDDGAITTKWTILDTPQYYRYLVWWDDGTVFED